jgi:alkylation response protein AidB-like acyl-CoA dehydrogenase
VSEDLSAEIDGVLADVLERGPQDPAGRWRALAQAGLLGLPVPQEYGGAGLGLSAVGVLLRGAARRGATVPLHETLPLLTALAPELGGDLLGRVAAGELMLAPALDQPGLAPAATRLVDGRLDGRTVGVPVFTTATLLVVTAATAEGPTVALVDPAGPGVSAAPSRSSSGVPEASYAFAEAPVVATFDAAAVVRAHVTAGRLLRGSGLLAGALELTAGYLGERSQFGRRLAEFQAVAQQVADVYVVARLTELAVAEVVRRLEAGDPVDDDLAIASFWLCDRVPASLQTCHHLHGGVGVDETYPLAAYTSGVLDLVRRLGGRIGTLAAAPATETAGKSAELTEEQRAFKQEVRAYFATLVSEADREEMLTDRHGPAYHRIIKQMGADGRLGVGWPREYGGQGRSGVEQQIFANEAAYADVHLPAVTLQTVGPTLQEFGTPRQKELFLPRILTGDVHFAIGYSEPDAGTDLASLRTTARRDGDHYVVNGQKLWTTGGHAADYIWLAARTDPSAPRHHGISILIVDTRDPGFSWTPIRTIDGSHHVNATYFNDVRVPADMLVGEENGGWRLITTQLNHERVMLGPAGRLEGLRDLVAGWAAAHGVLSVAPVREVLARTTASFRVNELLNWQVAARPAAGRAAVADASACKVFASAEVQRLGLDLLDVVATYGDPAEPETARLLRFLDAAAKRNLVLTFGGGVNEIQRELIAQFGLGLPRVPR